MKLTIKQKRFADEYILSGNATASAIKAGYSKNYAKAQSSKLLENVGIRDYIAKRIKEIDSTKVADQKEILEFLTRVVRREEVEQVVVTLKKPVTVTVEGSKNSYEKQTFEDVSEVVDIKNKLSDSIKAAEALGRIRKFGSKKEEKLKRKKLKADANISEAKARILNDNGNDTEAKVAKYLDKLDEVLQGDADNDS
ncbi:MAG: terminase small subunit [Liquorilactobacillus hordei]|uniref:terminase small subunit n=1 Tax=Liquorilactobacillus hordei TaxID=468911 RepID=UPI0039E87A7F